MRSSLPRRLILITSAFALGLLADPMSQTPFPSIAAAAVGDRPTLYVDSVAGSDANSGRSEGSPLQSLTAATAACGANERIGLKRGSFWRQSFNLTGKTAPSIEAYGSGAAPVISGADIITGWAAYTTGGRVNMYQKSVANECGATGRIVVFENGVQLRRVDTDAACDATPGSFVNPFSGGTANPVVVKIHPSSSTHAATDGKTYEINVRAVAFQGPNGCTISGIQTEKCNNNNGSMDLVNRTASAASKILAVSGTKHNLGIGSGSMVDCIACFSDGGSTEEPGEIPFIAFLENSSGHDVLFERCGVIGPAGKDFYHHSTGSYAYNSVTARQVWSVDTSNYTGGFNTLQGGYYRGVTSLPFGGNVSFLLADLPANHSANVPTGSVTDCAILLAQKSNNDALMRGQGTVVITNCAFYCNTPLTGGKNTEWWANASAAQNTMMNFCVYYNGTNSMQKHASGTYVGDHNVFRGSNVYNPNDQVNFQGTTYYNTLAAWQAYSGQDAQSVYLERADQTSGNPYAFWLGVSTGLNNGPVDGDWRINPEARVYSGANVAYIGTFPDGVSILRAGPQNKWDWNARRSVEGAPPGWPEVPDTLVEAQAYITDPEAWNFDPVFPEIAVKTQPSNAYINDGGNHHFGTEVTGSCTTITFTIRNIGRSDLILTGTPAVAANGPDAAMFRVTTQPVSPVTGPSGSSSFTVQFLPTSGGVKTAALTIPNNDSDEDPFDIHLTGIALAFQTTRMLTE